MVEVVGNDVPSTSALRNRAFIMRGCGGRASIFAKRCQRGRYTNGSARACMPFISSPARTHLRLVEEVAVRHAPPPRAVAAGLRAPLEEVAARRPREEERGGGRPRRHGPRRRRRARLPRPLHRIAICNSHRRCVDVPTSVFPGRCTLLRLKRNGMSRQGSPSLAPLISSRRPFSPRPCGLPVSSASSHAGSAPLRRRRKGVLATGTGRGEGPSLVRGAGHLHAFAFGGRGCGVLCGTENSAPTMQMSAFLHKTIMQTLVYFVAYELQYRVS